jgi:CO dehydrogenase/acetyl-CoA synthase delta subunit
MANFSFSKPLGTVPNIKITIHGMPYIITFMVMNNKLVDLTYSMLLKCPWLWDAKVIHDWGTNMVTIEGNIIVNTIYVSIYLSGNIRRP